MFELGMLDSTGLLQAGLVLVCLALTWTLIHNAFCNRCNVRATSRNSSTVVHSPVPPREAVSSGSSTDKTEGIQLEKEEGDDEEEVSGRSSSAGGGGGEPDEEVMRIRAVMKMYEQSLSVEEKHREKEWVTVTLASL